jgi:hypothetical protein
MNGSCAVCSKGVAITSRSFRKAISVARSFNASSIEKIAVKMYAFQS